MNFEILYALSKEAGFIISILSFMFSIIIWIIPTDEIITRTKKIVVGICCFLILGFLSLNYYFMQDYVEVPLVEGLEYSTAENKLESIGLNAKPKATQIFKRTDYVVEQKTNQGTIVKKGETIILVLNTESGFDENSTTTENTEETSQNIIIFESNETENSLDSQTTLSHEEKSTNEDIEHSSKDYATTLIESSSANEGESVLSIIIDEYEIFNDGYYYEEPDKENEGWYWCIDFDKGISGTFHYSRPLTDEELSDWGHGGSLYDANGNEIGEEGNYPHFWSDEKGYFAMQFPENLPSGKYTYVLYQFIGSQYVEAKIEFVI